MSEPWSVRAEDRDLWRRLRVSDSSGATRIATADADLPDEMTLAAYVEGRLDPGERDEVEAYLATHPEHAADAAAARGAIAPGRPEAGLVEGGLADAALASVVARASALVPASDDRVIAFRPASRPAEPSWRQAARWSALAASLAVAGYLGFALGSDTSNVLATLASSGVSADDLFDPSSGFLNGPSEMSGT